jgi:hypothetical protein
VYGFAAWVLKHLLGGFCYRFWTKVFPELKRNEKLDVSKLSKPDHLKIRRTVQAIERHVNLAGIALGALSASGNHPSRQGLVRIPRLASNLFLRGPF